MPLPTPLPLPDHETVSTAAAGWIEERLVRQPNSLLCLATGGTPMRAYERLAQHARSNPALLAQARILKLDEWGGIPLDRPATCESYLQESLIRPLGLGSRYVGFASQPTDPKQECARIASWLAAEGPIDLCILGLGLNGHLGFNEPADSLQPHAHIATLTPESLSHAMIAAEPVRPTYGLTLGMADLLQSREILLMVTGTSKREPLRRLLDGRISPSFPASFLWLHPRVTLLVDQAALA